MPNPTTAAEWALLDAARKCVTAKHFVDPLGGPVLLCFNCTDAYARQQVDAALERAAGIARSTPCPSCDGHDHDTRLKIEIAAALRALKGK